MRIAFVVNTFPKVTETFIIHQITGMIDKGHDVTIIAMHKSSIDSHHDAVEKYNLLDKTIYLDIFPRKYTDRISFILTRFWHQPYLFGVLMRASNVIKYRRLSLSLYLHYIGSVLYRSSPFDVIHCQFGTLAPLLLKLKAIGAIRGQLVTSFRGVDISRRLAQHGDMYEELFAVGALFLPVCSHFKDVLIQNGCDEKKIHVLYSGISIEELTYQNKKGINSPVRLISVGRLVRKKGFIYAIRAVHEIVKQGIDVTYVIIGDGNEYDHLKDTIGKHSLEKNVELVGWKNHSDVIRMIQESDILIAPSITTDDGDKEGIPNVLKEAMALGVPVIGTYHSGIPELIQDGVNGLLVQECDSYALADKILYLINNPKEVIHLCLEARSTIDENFDIIKLNQKLESLYTSVINT